LLLLTLNISQYAAVYLPLLLLLQLEWSTSSSFETAATTNQLVTYVPTGAGTYTITALTMGTPYYIRLSTVNGLGKGPATTLQMATPLAPSDAPAQSLLQQLDPLLTSTVDVGHSLNVTWLPPQLNAASVGSGGAAVLDYLIETSTASFSSYVSAVQTVTDNCVSGSLGLLRFSFDTTAVAAAALKGPYTSYAISAAGTTADVVLALESVDNIGTVTVNAAGGGFGANAGQWLITFTSELGPLPDLTIDTSAMTCGGAAATAPTIATTTAGAPLPASPSYKTLVAAAADSSKVLTGLLPGTLYYTRVSARTVLGYGARQASVPDGAGAVGSGYRVPYLKPDAPVSPWYSAGFPTLAREGDSALRVAYGAPLYDGGDRLTTFEVQWDTSASFSSGAAGAPLGSASTAATARLCNGCVDSFTLSTLTLALSGAVNFYGQLEAGQRILVGGVYTFTVANAQISATTIKVTSVHNALADLTAGYGGSLDLYAGHYTMSSLAVGVPHYVRVFAKNQAKGVGASASAGSLVPLAPPLAPAQVTLSLAGADALRVQWPAAASRGDAVDSYLVEVYSPSATVSASGSLFGVREVQTIAVTRPINAQALALSTFTLAYGPVNVPLPGTVIVSKNAANQYVLTTSADLTAVLRRGDAIIIQGVATAYEVHAFLPFDATTLTLASVTSPVVTPQDLGQSAVLVYTGTLGVPLTAYRAHTTQPISAAASAQEVAAALSALPPVGDVTATVTSSGSTSTWSVTFAALSAGTPLLRANGRQLGAAGNIAVTRALLGLAPPAYYSSDSVTGLSYTASGLKVGTYYYVRVTPVGATSGLGASATSAVGTPMAAPGALTSYVTLKPLNATALWAQWEQRAAANGAAVTNYTVEWDRSATFSTAARAAMIVAPSSMLQAVRTSDARTDWDPTSTFTLSLLDFGGSYTKLLAVVIATEGSSTLTVDTTAAGFAAVNLSVLAPRGSLLRVGGQSFSVCHDLSEPLTASTLILCEEEDPYTVQTFTTTASVQDDTQHFLPVYSLDTAEGVAAAPTVGATSITTTPYDLTAVVARGDYLRLGHPVTGATFTVCEPAAIPAPTATTIQLCSEDDASKQVSLLPADLTGAVRTIVQLQLMVNSAGYAAAYATAFRLEFSTASSTVTTEQCFTVGAIVGAGASPAWTNAQYEAAMAAAIEQLPGIDSVAVGVDTSTINTYTYSITFTGALVTGQQLTVQAVDVDINDCATAAGDNTMVSFSNSVVQSSSIPIYLVERTVDISYDASEADVKAALEALSGTCAVDVTRTDSSFGYEWLVTFVEGAAQPLVALRPSGVDLLNIDTTVKPAVTIVPIARVALQPVVTGVPYYARAYANNAIGAGTAVASRPTSLQPAAQPPSEPRAVTAAPVSTTELLVQWDAPLLNGGLPVSQYLVEWDTAASFGSAQRVTVAAASSSPVSDVQSVVLAAPAGRVLAGTFSLSFAEQRTVELLPSASAETVKAALQALCNVQQVEMSRTDSGSDGGSQWLITFVETSHSGSQSYSSDSLLQVATAQYGHKLSVHGDHLVHCLNFDMTGGCTHTSSLASVGSRPEQQMLECPSGAAGTFVLDYMGKTVTIDATVTVGTLAEALWPLAGAVSVSSLHAATDPVCNNGIPHSFTMTLEDALGDVPLITTVNPAVTTYELVKGRSQPTTGRKPFSSTLAAVAGDWYVRVSAYNALGYGHSGDAVAAVTVPAAAVAPQPPVNVTLLADAGSDTSAIVAWSAPTSDGGSSPVTDYTLEWDTALTFASACGGGPAVQTLSVSFPALPVSSADATFNLIIDGVPVTGAPCLNWDITAADLQTAIQGASAARFSSVTVARSGDPVIPTLAWGFGYTWSVTFDGVSPAAVPLITVDTSGCTAGVAVWAVKAVTRGDAGAAGDCDAAYRASAGFATVSLTAAAALGALQAPPVPYAARIAGLTPGVAVTARAATITAAGTSSWSAPTALKAAVAAPALPQRRTFSTAAAPGAVHVGIGRATQTRAEGSNGTPVTRHSVQLAQRVSAVQRVAVPAAAAAAAGSYKLLLNGDATWCLAATASAAELEMAIEALPHVDGATVTAATAAAGTNYTVSFDGPVTSNGPVAKMLVAAASSDCSAALTGAALPVVTVDKAGNYGAVAPVYSFGTTAVAAPDAIAGSLVLSFFSPSRSFTPTAPLYVRLGEAASGLQVTTTAGSATVATPIDVSAYITAGDTISIGGELATVAGNFQCAADVSDCAFDLDRYFPTTTTDFAFVSGASLGVVRVTTGSAAVLTALDLTLRVAAGQNIVLRDPVSGALHTGKVLAVAASSITLTPATAYTGASGLTAAFAMETTAVPADATAAELAAALSALPGAGTVTATRQGTGKLGANDWSVTFYGALDAVLTVSDIAVEAVTVAGAGCTVAGDYIASGWAEGRRTYKLRDRAVVMKFSAVAGGWSIWSGGAAVALNDVDFTVQDTLLPADSTWSGTVSGCSSTVAPVAVLQYAVLPVVAVRTTTGQFPDFVAPALVSSLQTAVGVPEVQAIVLSASDASLDGMFSVSYGGESFLAAHNIAAADMETRLEALVSIGNVAVTRTAAAAGYGYTWSVTFSSQLGDLPLLGLNSAVVNQPPITPAAATLTIQEVTKGVAPQSELTVTGLDAQGGVYAARAAAVNAAGAEQYAEFDSATVTTGTAPAAPVIANATAISSSELEVRHTALTLLLLSFIIHVGSTRNV
jgi:hypothetical protein